MNIKKNKMKQYIFMCAVALLFIQCNKTTADKMADGKGMKNTEAFRTKAPGPSPARPINLGNYSSFVMDNGLQVIVVENHKLPRVSYQISLNNDPIKEGDQVGYVEFAGELISKGTTTRPKAKLDEETDFIGGTINSSPNGLFGSSLKKHSSKLLDLMSDILLNPIFPESEFDKIKKQAISSLASAKTDANAIASNVSARINYGKNHPYGEIQTEKSVNNITLENCKKYYETYFRPNNAYLVIVGDINEAEAKQQAMKYFAKWKQGPIPSQNYTSAAAPTKPSVSFANKDGAVQSVINITYPVDLQIGSENELSAALMNNILGGGIFSGRLMQNLREKRAYTYGARSSLSSDKLVGNFNAFANVRNMVTDSSVEQFIYEMDRISKEPVTENDIQLAKNSMAGGFARSLESPQTIANFALNTFKYKLPKDYYNTYLSRLDKLTIEDVQRAAKKYITPQNANILVVGNKDEVAKSLLKFDGDGKIDYYDAYGEVLNYDNVEIPANVTGKSIIEDYLDAIGGQAKLSEIKSMVTNATMPIMGKDAVIITKQKLPNKFFASVMLGEMKLQEQKSDGTKASITQMGRPAKIAIPGEKEFDEIQERITIFEQLNYLNTGYKLDVKGIEEVNGNKCYKVQVTEPSGKTTLQFFDMKTNLLRMTSSTEGEGDKARTVSSEYNDYKDVKGVLMPHEVVIVGQAPMPLTMKVLSFEVNTPISDTEFEVK
jgi:zinc protease